MPEAKHRNEDMLARPDAPTTCTDVLVKIGNFMEYLPLQKPREYSNFRWANIIRDAPEFAKQFSPYRNFKVYGRLTARYKFHPLQRFHNELVRFDVTDKLASKLIASGNHAFYHDVFGQAPSETSFPADVTEIDSISSLRTSAEYLYKDLLLQKGHKVADQARKFYLRGFSRKVIASDADDWHQLREEINNDRHQPTTSNDVESEDPQDTLLTALSYKGNSLKISHRIRSLNEDGSPVENEKSKLQQEEITMTAYFTDDFRWSQVVRSCMELARCRGAKYVRIWIDRLVGMGLSSEEKKVKASLDWTEYGLFPYAICPVIRLYENSEPEYGTNFWRKLETVLAVAGRGLVVDEYSITTYDFTLYYGPDLYRRLNNGLALIGGTGIYIRSVTLALATAMFTDTISFGEVNEDMRTRKSVRLWKSWALRTISEGAYSANHPFMMKEEEPITLGFSHFRVIAFWESMMSSSDFLQGSNYLNLALQRSCQYLKVSEWDGVQEWLGMMGGSYNLKDRERIMEYLHDHVQITSYAATSGHISSLLELKTKDGGYKRTIVVNLSRMSTLESSYVTAIAEGTGLRGKPILPGYLQFVPNPDRDQEVKILNLHSQRGKYEMDILYKRMKVRLKLHWFVYAFILFLSLLSLFGSASENVGAAVTAVVVLITIGLLIYAIRWIPFWKLMRGPWPWVDQNFIGEAVFDNVLMHALFASGIKSCYRQMRNIKYDEIYWR